jgi:hypothetical protein
VLWIPIAIVLLFVLLPQGPSTAPEQTDSATPDSAVPDSAVPDSATHEAADKNAVVADAFQFTATYNSISVDLAFTGDDDADSTAKIQFRRSGESVWRDGLDLWRWADETTRGFTGSVLLLEPGTPYEVKVAVNDPDGGNVERLGTATTRVDGLFPEPEKLVPTHYVDASTGSDNNDGLNPDSAWGTLERAVAAANIAQGSMIVRVAPGYYAAPSTTLTGNGQAIAFTAANAAVDTHGDITETAHSVIYGGYVAPQHSGDKDSLGEGGWILTDLPGPGHRQNYSGPVPDPPPHYQVWARDVGSNKVMELSYTPVVGADYAKTKASEPLRIPYWPVDKTEGKTTLDTANGIAETVHTNYSYNAGFWQDGSGNRVYLVLPGGLDPNDGYIWLSSGGKNSGNSISGFTLNGPNLRISGFSFRVLPQGIKLSAAAANAVIDHNLTRNNGVGVYTLTSTPNATERADFATIQYNTFSDSNLWSVTERAIPWRWIKTRFITRSGEEYAGLTHYGQEDETGGIKVNKNGSGWVIRYNTFDGPFNGVGGANDNTDRRNYFGFDIHDNKFTHISDDVLEPEGVSQNWRFWNNTISDVRVVASTDNSHGPHYVFRNTAWNVGVSGVGDDGNPVNPSKNGAGSFVKYGTKATPSARWFFVHNTFWTNDPMSSGWADSVGTANKESWWLRNNLIRTPKYSILVRGTTIGGWDEDYNFFASDTGAGVSSGGFRYLNKFYNAAAISGSGSIASYRSFSHMGAHTNLLGGTDYNFIRSADNRSGLNKIDGLFVSPQTGDLRLAPGSAAVDTGIPVPNISDRAGVNYAGQGPDLGARESK